MKPEAQLSCAVREAVELYHLRDRCICFKIQNDLTPGAKTRLPMPAYIAMLKRQGFEPGVADWVFIWVPVMEELYGGLVFKVGFIELKIAKNKQSEGQVLFQDWCQKVGPDYRVARSIDNVIQIWQEWRLI